MIESKHKADVFHFNLYLHLFIGIGCVVFLDMLYIWMCCIFGCIVFLDELVMIGLGIRIRQGFEGEELRIGYKPDDRSHPKIKQKKESLEDFSSKLSL